MLHTSFHSDAKTAAKAERRDGHVWVTFGVGDSYTGSTIYMPDHPDAFEAAQTIALAFNSLSKPALKEAA